MNARQRLIDLIKRELDEGAARLAVSLLNQAEEQNAERLHAELNGVVDAWETLPGGRQVPIKDVETWLATNMAPAINSVRSLLGRAMPGYQ